MYWKCLYPLIILSLVSCLSPSYSADSEYYRAQIKAMKMSDKPLKAQEVDAVWRRPLIQWAFNYSRFYNIPYEVVSLASEIFEHLLEKKHITIEAKNQYFAVCYVIAVKVLDGDILFSEVTQYASNLNKSQMKYLERQVCERLKWHLYYSTPHTFISVFEDQLNDKVGPDLAKPICDYAKYIADMKLFHDRSGLTNYQVALNAMIDSINRTQMYASTKEDVFSAMNEIIHDN